MTEAPHCATCRCGERFPVQGEWKREKQRTAGTVSMAEAEAAYNVYAAQSSGLPTKEGETP